MSEASADNLDIVATLSAELVVLRTENARLRRELSKVEADRDLQHSYGKDLQEQLDRERNKAKGCPPTPSPTPTTTSRTPAGASAGSPS